MILEIVVTLPDNHCIVAFGENVLLSGVETACGGSLDLDSLHHPASGTTCAGWVGD